MLPLDKIIIWQMSVCLFKWITYQCSCTRLSPHKTRLLFKLGLGIRSCTSNHQSNIFQHISWISLESTALEKDLLLSNYLFKYFKFSKWPLQRMTGSSKAASWQGRWEVGAKGEASHLLRHWTDGGMLTNWAVNYSLF